MENPIIPNSDARLPAETMDEHIFRWFNERFPDLMAKCLADYPDNDPEFRK